MEDVSLDETLSETFSQNHSPKVSTNGTFDDSINKRDASLASEMGPGLQGHSLHDHHHWDMPRFGGAKSVTSSVGVERDESVADEQTVEVGEVTEELQQVDEEEPTEIVLAQVEEQELANGIEPAEIDRSIAGTASQTPSKQGSLVMDAVDSMADRITHGNMSPSQAAEALNDLALNPNNSEIAGSSSSGHSASAAQHPLSADETTQQNAVQEGGLEEGSGVGGGSELGLEEVTLSERQPQVSEAASQSASQAHGDSNHDDEGGDEGGSDSEVFGSVGEDEAESGLTTGEQQDAQQAQQQQGDSSGDGAESRHSVEENGVEEGGGAETGAEGDLGGKPPTGAAANREGGEEEEGAGAVEMAAAAAVVAHHPVAQEGEGGVQEEEEGDEEAAEAAAVMYQSRLMQQLTASEEDDLTVYRSSDMDTGGYQPPSNGVLRNPAATAAAPSHPPPAAAAATAAGLAAGRHSAGAPPESFEIDAAPETGAAGSAAARPSAAQAAAEVQAANDAWERTFKGLLYVDGVDALGRPVVVVNADAVPPRMKSSALVYCKTHLEPVVNKGHYVLVFTAKKAKLPSMWIMGAWRSLPRPYRKNVQYIILVRPSGFLKAILAFMRPFVSKKAGRKIKQVEVLGEISEATGGEVGMQHLGSKFNDEVVSQD